MRARPMIVLMALLPTLAFGAEEERRAERRPPPGAVQPAPGEQPLAVVPGGQPVADGPRVATPRTAPPVVVVQPAQPPPEPAQPPPVVVVRPAPPEQPVEVRAEPRRRKRMGIAGGFGHLGFGGGLAVDPIGRTASPEFRFTFGGTGFALIGYGGGSFEAAHTGYTPISVGGVGRAGLALPLPRGKLLLGAHGGGGAHLDSHGPGPQLVAGPEIGFVAFNKRGNRGFRMLFEVDAVGKPTKGEGYLRWGLTAAMAF